MVMLIVLVWKVFLVDAIDVLLYSNDLFKGTVNQLHLNDGVPDYTKRIGSCSILTENITLVLYTQPNYLGKRSIIVKNDSSIASYIPIVRSIQVLSISMAYSLVRTNPMNVIALHLQKFYGIGYFIEYGPGSAVSTMKNMVPWLLVYVDVPNGIYFQFFRRNDFQGPAYLWNDTATLKFVRSFRVFKSKPVMPSLPLEATFFPSDFPDTPDLAVRVGEEVRSLTFLRGIFSISINGIDVAPQVIVILYSFAHYKGPFQILREGTHSSSIINAQSFRVMSSSAVLPTEQPSMETYQSVQCFLWNLSTTYGIDDVFYHFDKGMCSEMTIPPTLTVVAFTRTWLLGKSIEYTNTHIDSSVTINIRSFKIMAKSSTTQQMNHGISVEILGMGGQPRRYLVGEAYPSTDIWELPPSTYSITIRIPPNVLFMTCSEFDFKGNCTTFKANVSYSDGVYPSYRSASAFYSNSSFINGTFVGCYTQISIMSLTPVFLQVGENVSNLIYPWSQNIVRVTIPSSMILLTYSEPNFGGLCAAWSNDLNLPSPWNTSVQSLQVWDANQHDKTKACLEQVPQTDMILPPANSSVFNTLPSTEMVDPFRPPASARHPSNGIAFTIAAICGVIGIAFLILVLVAPWFRKKVSTKPRVPEIATLPSTELTQLCWGDLDLVRLATAPLPLTKFLGQGTTGAVYLSTFCNEPVVVKIPLSNTLNNIQAIIDEISYVRDLHSPSILTLVGAIWTHPSQIQMVVEYMNLGDLRMYLATTIDKEFSWVSKLECAIRVAEALFYLHSQQLIHRDVKSRNVFLDSVKGAKLGDFGNSGEGSCGIETLTGGVGTSRWMAPEMLLFMKYSSAVDIYSFGVLLSELNTHQIPYMNMNMSDEAILSRVLYEGLRPTFRSDCPAWYHDIVCQCLSKDPSLRPSAVRLIHVFKSNLRMLKTIV